MFESKEQKELAKMMIDNLRGQFSIFYLTVLLEGQDEPAVISSKMLEHPFSSYIEVRTTCIWGKKLKRILGVAKTQEQAEAIKLHYEITPHKDFYYVVYGTYPNIGIDKREYVSEDSYNYCLRGEYGNLDIISKDKVFGKFEDAVAKQCELIQAKDKVQLSFPADTKITISNNHCCCTNKTKKSK